MRMKRLPSLSLAKMESESRRQMNDEAECSARKSVARSRMQTGINAGALRAQVLNQSEQFFMP